MNLLEYQAKKLLEEHGAPVPRSWLMEPKDAVPESIVYPVMAKGQVPVGGRGKAGGIVEITAADDAPQVIVELFALSIKGYRPSAVLLEEKLAVSRELYLALRLDRDTRTVQWLGAAEGGVDIESNASSIHTIAYDDVESLSKLAAALNLTEAQLSPVISALADSFFAGDLLLCEINPLVLTADGTLLCADAKCLVDDNARFRRPEMSWPPDLGNLPAPLEQGTIGCIANGAGMAMSTMDTIVAMGGRPANFLDIGGGTGEKEFVVALKNIMELPGVTSIIVNIFAGISRCDEIARGIIAAHKQLPNLPPLFIRLEGTNRDIAAELLTAAGIIIEPDLKTCVKKALEITIDNTAVGSFSEGFVFPTKRGKTNNHLAPSEPSGNDVGSGIGPEDMRRKS